MRIRFRRAPASDLSRGFGLAYRLPYRVLGFSNVVLVRVPLSRPEKTSKTILMLSGDNVDVKVGYALADAVVYCDESTVSVEAQFDRLGQHLRACEQRTYLTSGQVVQGLVVLFRHQQAVAWGRSDKVSLKQRADNVFHWRHVMVK